MQEINAVERAVVKALVETGMKALVAAIIKAIKQGCWKRRPGKEQE